MSSLCDACIFYPRNVKGVEDIAGRCWLADNIKMSWPIHAVTVYCSSSGAVPQVYFNAARELAGHIAGRHWKLVYGGNSVGVMGVLADAVRAAGGKVIGVTPRLFIDNGT